MASVVQQTRTRSTRVTAASTTPKPQAAVQGHRQVSGGEVVVPVTALTPSEGGPCSLALFLTNIKLLDLDLLSDWPNISAETFATSGTSVQGQKKRVHCVEWLLFRLFSIWDPEETAILKPLFPPLDQLQSVNLRAALVRSLEKAKKNGVLGRDTVIRKTMLDDCKGERLMELLAYFSTVVLKKVVSDDVTSKGRHLSPVIELAFENRGYKGEKTELAVLTLAHRASLRRLLESKRAARARYQDFARLLGVKERGVARRNEVVLAKELNGSGQMVSDNTRADMRRTLRNNWSGNEGWIETLLRGDAQDRGLVNTPFDRVWRRVQQGQLGELEANGAGLLQQLESRVRVQKDRLKKWDSFRRDMFGEPNPLPSLPETSTAKARGIDLGFGAHLELHLRRVSKPAAAVRNQEHQMPDDYAGLVSDLKEELANITKKKVSVDALFRGRMPIRHERRGISISSTECAGEDEISDLEDAEDAFHPDLPVTSFQNKLAGANRPHIRPRLSRLNLSQVPSQKSAGPTMTTGQKNFPGKSAYDIDNFSPPLPAPPLHQAGASASDVPMRRPDTKPTLAPASVSQPLDETLPAQDLADQILGSMDKASPSPLKRTKPRHTLSLAERTRLSLTRKKSLLFEDVEPDLPTVATIAEEAVAKADSSEPAEDLVSRTRRSMANFEMAQRKAQLERRRSQRRSKLPSRREGNHFPKVAEDLWEANRLADLLAEENMEAVFKSRPKVKEDVYPSPIKERAMAE